MDLQLEAVRDEFAELLELHHEMAEELDVDDPEVRSVWLDIESRMKVLGRRLRSMQGAHRSDPDEIEDFEQLLAEINDAFGELAVLR